MSLIRSKSIIPTPLGRHTIRPCATPRSHAASAVSKSHHVAGSLLFAAPPVFRSIGNFCSPPSDLREKFTPHQIVAWSSSAGSTSQSFIAVLPACRCRRGPLPSSPVSFGSRSAFSGGRLAQPYVLPHPTRRASCGPCPSRTFPHHGYQLHDALAR